MGKVTPFGGELYESWNAELETFRETNYVLCHPEWKPDVPHVKWWNG